MVGGQTLVEQAKIRGIISDINKYKLALNAYKLEYNAIPGDHNAAADYGLGNSGDGNRQIINANDEGHEFWAHLSNANIIPGSYDPSILRTINVSLPASSYGNNTAFTPGHSGSSANNIGIGNNPIYGYYYGNLLQLGQQIGGAPGRSNNGFLSVSSSRSLELKIDDGEPGTGKVLVGRGNSGGGCTDVGLSNPLPVAFNYSNTSKNCRLFFLID